MTLKSGTRLGLYGILALAIGLGIGYVDSLPTWDFLRTGTWQATAALAFALLAAGIGGLMGRFR